VILHFEKLNYLILITISISTGLFSYFVLSYLLVAPKITIPLSIVFPMLTFGLTKYYSTSNFDINKRQDQNLAQTNIQHDEIPPTYDKNGSNVSSILFVVIYAIAILISSSAHQQEFHIFINWNEIGTTDIFQLGASIALCFFIPGFAIVLVITKKYNINSLLSVLLGYLFSILITGLTAYISGLIFDIPTSDSKGLFTSVYVSIIVFFLVFYPEHRIIRFSDLRTKNYFDYQFIVTNIIKFFQHLKTRINECIVFGSLISLIIISTYYLYGGTTIGDQWYHQGRSLLFMSGAFREASMTGAEVFYPPFQSALLAALTVLSGIPLVNSYASIAIVNIVPIFAYFYFFSTWVPSTMRKAALFACSLFTISSGFGWIYLLTTATRSHIFSVLSSLETLRDIGHLDIISASNFVMATAPDFSTALIYIALPAGFVLLGILRASFQSAYIRFAVIAAISVLGIMSHYEFYIFIIIASILPIIFKIKGGNYIYLSFYLAFFIIYLIDVTAPGSYLSSLEINGFSLLLLSVSFVSICWTIYLGYPRIRRASASICSFFSESKFQHRILRINFHVGALIVSLVAYFYLFSFIVLSQLPLDTIIDHTFSNNIPWYLYPMKMGTAGLFGLAFILSYIFKRFEKQVFVFGVLMLVSFIAGPYYDEDRFAKYFMAGMIGFASLMIYDLLNRKFTNKNVINTLLVSAIITTSGLSVLAFIGYSSLILQAQDYTNTLPRRHFPSDSDLRLFEILHNKFDVNSRYNVISFLNEYNRAEDGLISKVSSFAGLPYNKLYQSPLALNASTLDALYHHLWYSDTRYLIIPKETINSSNMVTEPTRFVIEHFTPIYQDDNYLVLEVPSLVPPSSSSKSKIALVYDQGKNFTEERLSETVLLPYDSSTFNFSSNLVNIQKLNQTEYLNLFGSKSGRGISVWTKNIVPSKGANYIETGFQIKSENENKSNDIRIEWQEAGMWEYYVKLSTDGLELYKKSDTGKKTLLKNTELEKLYWKWYTLKIESLPDSINIYVDNVLKIQAPKVTGNSTGGISKIGLTTFYNDVQFMPVKFGTVTSPSHNYEVASDHDHNYPLTLLASARLSYDTFSSDDLSMLSKDAILVPSSVLSDNVTINRYLHYAKGGGTLIILNSHGSFSSMAGKVFSLKSNETNQEAFTHISGTTNQNVSINIPGLVNRINAVTLPDVQVIASYRNNKNETIAPFILEKRFPTGGKILLVNSEGYFNTISNFSRQYFSSLSNISSLLPIELPESTAFQNTALPTKGFVGRMKISGVVTLNSSSLLLNEGLNAFPIDTSRIIIFSNDSKLPITFNNVSVKNLKLIGDYHLNINFTGQSELPDASSYHDYIGMQIPTDFNMSVNLGPKSSGHIQIVNKDDSVTNSISLFNNSKVQFYKMQAATPLNSVPVLVKKPEIKVNGHVYIKNAYLDGYLTERGKLYSGAPVDLQGQVVANFAFVDKFNQPYHNATKTRYITYLQSLTMDRRLDQDEEKLRLPSDIYFKANEKVPLKKILGSPINIIVLGGLIITVILGSKFLWKKNLQA
jgi:hypothetical protein